MIVPWLPKTRIVKQKGEEVVLTATEFSLLEELLRRVGQVVSREKLTEKVLGRELLEQIYRLLELTRRPLSACFPVYQ